MSRMISLLDMDSFDYMFATLMTIHTT